MAVPESNIFYPIGLQIIFDRVLMRRNLCVGSYKMDALFALVHPFRREC